RRAPSPGCASPRAGTRATPARRRPTRRLRAAPRREAAADSSKRPPSEVLVPPGRRRDTDGDADDGAEHQPVGEATRGPADDRAEHDARGGESEEDAASAGQLEVGTIGGLHRARSAYQVCDT